MVDKSINRTRVAGWRAKKYSAGYKGLRVFLAHDVFEMVRILRRHFRSRRKTSELITKAIRNLYKSVEKDIDNPL